MAHKHLWQMGMRVPQSCILKFVFVCVCVFFIAKKTKRWRYTERKWNEKRNHTHEIGDLREVKLYTVLLLLVLLLLLLLLIDGWCDSNDNNRIFHGYNIYTHTLYLSASLLATTEKWDGKVVRSVFNDTLTTILYGNEWARTRTHAHNTIWDCTKCNHT